MKKYLLWTFGILFVYRFILALQGFDLTDEGFVLTFYQQIFHAPETVEYQFLYYLASLIGGVWNFLFGFGGIFSFRILAIIVDLLIIYVTCLTVKKYLRPQPQLILIAALFIALFHFGVTVFHHNQLTALLIAISVYFILKGLNAKDSHRPLFWGAFFCGVNIFTRIPNVTMIGLGLLLFVDYYYEKNSRRLWKNISYSFLGLISGILLVLAIMFFCGHLEIFRQSIVNNLFNLATEDTSTHSLVHQIKSNLANYEAVYIYLSVFVLTTGLCIFVYNQFKNKWAGILSIIFYSALVLTFFIAFDFNNGKYYALILLPLLISLVVDRHNKSIMLLNMASLLVLFLLPLGSGLGIRDIGKSCIWLGTFVTVIHVFRFIQYQIKSKGNDTYRTFFVLFFALYVISCLVNVSYKAYCDDGSRLEKRYRTDNSKFTVFTTKDKADAINELLFSLNKYVKKDDYLLCFESLPMIHYLTETKPYIGVSWVWCYTPGNFKKHLDQSVATLPLPVVLQQKCQPIGGNWTVPEYVDKKSDPFLYNMERIGYFEKFIRDNQYKVTWENDLFVIYTVK
ncbi:hypothetical protein FACS1894145_5380 [Bacteroidia bacterium]|nr:hypothetical protein FACS189446_0340 [Bacteroidia bacterium]GHU79990.1 hypothetical protein FACS1894145_5380 [Bacteroidia bacterium]